MSDRVTTPADHVSFGLLNDILAGIMVGDYPPDSRLPTEQRFARDYGVSRTVVRSALERLKREGVVQSRQGSGTIVAACDPSVIARLNRDAQLPSLQDCYACRLAIEPAIAAAVATNLSAEARTFLEDHRRLLESGDLGNEYERSAQDAQFHMGMAKFSGNFFFISIMNTLRPHILFSMNIAKSLINCSKKHHFDLSEQEHLNIVSAILQQDPTAAHAAMHQHLENGSARIFQSEH